MLSDSSASSRAFIYSLILSKQKERFPNNLPGREENNAADAEALQDERSNGRGVLLVFCRIAFNGIGVILYGLFKVSSFGKFISHICTGGGNPDCKHTTSELSQTREHLLANSALILIFSSTLWLPGWEES